VCLPTTSSVFRRIEPIECLDHAIILSERHLRRVLSSYFQYHHEARTHLSLNKDCPQPRPVSYLPQAIISSPSRRSVACIIAMSVEPRKDRRGGALRTKLNLERQRLDRERASTNYRGSRLLLPRRKSTKSPAISCRPEVPKRGTCSRNLAGRFNLLLPLENWSTLFAPVMAVWPGRPTCPSEIAVIVPPYGLTTCCGLHARTMETGFPFAESIIPDEGWNQLFWVAKFKCSPTFERVLLFNTMDKTAVSIATRSRRRRL
jgi:hypothetical protein